MFLVNGQISMKIVIFYASILRVPELNMKYLSSEDDEEDDDEKMEIFNYSIGICQTSAFSFGKKYSSVIIFKFLNCSLPTHFYKFVI